MGEKQILTEQSRNRLFDFVGNEIKEDSKEVDFIYRLRKILNGTNRALSDILALHMHVLFILLDFNTVYRMHLKAQLPYEKRFTLRQMNVIMLEGFKRIYGFGKATKKSLLYSIRPEVNVITSTDSKGYDQVVEALTILGESKHLNKDSRDLSIHYDVDVDKFYEMNVKIKDAEEIFLNMCSSLKTFKKLTAYLKKVDYPFIQKILHRS